MAFSNGIYGLEIFIFVRFLDLKPLKPYKSSKKIKIVIWPFYVFGNLIPPQNANPIPYMK